MPAFETLFLKRISGIDIPDEIPATIPEKKPVHYITCGNIILVLSL